MFFAMAKASDAPLEIYLYDPCGGCPSAKVPCGECREEKAQYDFYLKLLRDIGQDGRDIRLHNMRKDAALYAGLEEVMQALGEADFDLPVLVIGEAAFPAAPELYDLVRGYLLGETEYPGFAEAVALWQKALDEKPARSVVFLFDPGDEESADIEEFLGKYLSEDIAVRAFDVTTGDGEEMARAVRKFYALEEEVEAPTVVYGDYVFSGKTEIYLSLRSRIEENPKMVTAGDADIYYSLTPPQGGC